MSRMFYKARAFNQAIGGWDVSSVANMNGMFENATSFSKKSLRSWKVARVTEYDDFLKGAGPGNKPPHWPKVP